MDDEVNDDGMSMIIEPGYKLEHLRNYLKDTCYADVCDFVNETDDVEKICKGFLQMFKYDINLDEITTMFVASSMLYYIDARVSNTEIRTYLLHKAFYFVDTLHPVHIHLAAKRLFEGLKLQDGAFELNIISLCAQLSVASETGRAVALCLNWAIICEFLEISNDMYSFREFAQLIIWLDEIDDDLVKMEDNSQAVYILVRCIGFLTNSIVFGQNEDFKKAGYLAYFTYSVEDLIKLRDWAEKVCEMMENSTSKTKKFWDLRMMIKEYLQAGILAVLQDKISDIEPPKSFE